MAPFAQLLVAPGIFTERVPAAAFESRTRCEKNTTFDEDNASSGRDAVASVRVHWPWGPPCLEEEDYCNPLHSTKAARFCLGQPVNGAPSNK
jgi:hypothetical protein